MIEQLKTFKGNTIAIEVIDGFDESDEKFCQKLFEELGEGHAQVNVLIKVDEMKVSYMAFKAFMEDTLWTLRNYRKMGHLAIVAHSNVLKALVPIDNLFFQRASNGRYERYFDVSQLEEALVFVSEEPR